MAWNRNGASWSPLAWMIDTGPPGSGSGMGESDVQGYLRASPRSGPTLP